MQFGERRPVLLLLLLLVDLPWLPLPAQMVQSLCSFAREIANCNKKFKSAFVTSFPPPPPHPPKPLIMKMVACICYGVVAGILHSMWTRHEPSM